MDLDHLHAIRDRELESIIDLIRRFKPSEKPLDVLDVGAGSGRQAAGLAARGHRVSAVDIDTSAYSENACYPISIYDGNNLPFTDSSFDIVVSSNVLEHVQDLDGLLADMKRVLRKDGIAVHVLPTHTWRVWTTIAHAPWVVKRSWQLAAGTRQRRIHAGGDSRAHAQRRGSMSVLLPGRHGERGNLLTESWYFSPKWWKRTFRRNGWIPVHDARCGLFYTGTMLFSTWLNMKTRQRLARILGSAAQAYVLRPVSKSGDGNAV